MGTLHSGYLTTKQVDASYDQLRCAAAKMADTLAGSGKQEAAHGLLAQTCLIPHAMLHKMQLGTRRGCT